jgi:hypothetical protein
MCRFSHNETRSLQTSEASVAIQPHQSACGVLFPGSPRRGLRLLAMTHAGDIARHLMCGAMLVLAACTDKPPVTYTAPKATESFCSHELWQLRQKKVLEKESEIVRHLDDQRLKDEYEDKKVKVRPARPGGNLRNEHIEGKWSGYPRPRQGRHKTSRGDGVPDPSKLIREPGLDFSIGF